MLKIKKQIRDPRTNLVIEIEGTEDEVESYERKMEKKRQSEETEKKKKLLLEEKERAKQAKKAEAETKKKLDALLKPIEKMTKDELLHFIAEQLKKLQAPSVIHHYWHYNNGYWWRPYWDGITWTYQYSLSNPQIYGTSQGTAGVYGCAVNSNSLKDAGILTCNSVEDFSKTTGIDTQTVSTNLMSAAMSVPADNQWAVIGANSSGQAWGQNSLKIGDLKFGNADDNSYGTVLTTTAPVGTYTSCVVPADSSKN